MQFGLDDQSADQLKLFAGIIGLLWGVFKVLRSTRPETLLQRAVERKSFHSPYGIECWHTSLLHLLFALL
jgi:hypothetical protein